MAFPLTDILRILIAALILILASIQDWKERRADNRYWITGGIAGFEFLVWELIVAGSPLFYHLFVMAVAWIYFDVFWEGEEIFGEDGINLKGFNTLRFGLYLFSAAVFAGGIYLFWGDMKFSILLSVLVMILFIYLMYMFDVIKGGADAKALMMLSILFPHYPAVSSIVPSLPIINSMTGNSFSGPLTWEQVLIPFSFIVFMTAALVSLLIPLGLFAFNLLRGDGALPQAFFGYKMPVSEVEEHHVWLMERVVDGRIKLSLFPRDDVETQIPLLREMGVDEVWVNPKIPFLIPITAAFAISIFMGNVLFILL